MDRAPLPQVQDTGHKHDQEGEIISQAGKKGCVTIATNMAGRGVDIILGGKPYEKSKFDDVLALGGLHVHDVSLVC